MKSFLLAAKIAAVFTGLLLAALLLTLMLFLRVAGHDTMRELGLLVAHQGVAMAEEIEHELEDVSSLDDASFDALFDRQIRQSGLRMRLVTAEEPPRPLVWYWPHERRSRTVKVDGRVCRIDGPPVLEVRVPIYLDGVEIRQLAIEDPLHTRRIHDAFLAGLQQIGLVSVVLVLALALYLTAPLRRMRRSMDLIAAGELGHRVEVRGSGEVADMGRSFNTMADRIGAMLTGQKELMAGISHELRSPLARMKLHLELLRRDAGPGEAGPDDAVGQATAAELERRTRGLESEIDQLDEMVEELLLASRFELGSVPLEIERLDLAELAAEAWRRVALSAAEQGLELRLQLAADARAVAADRGLLVRCLGNLFENALRHAGTGEVLLTSERRAEGVRLKVTDQGPGVDEEHLEHLFEPFYRVDPSRSRQSGAGGLGLMIVRRAVLAHGGKVSARRALGGGLEVVLELPVDEAKV